MKPGALRLSYPRMIDWQGSMSVARHQTSEERGMGYEPITSGVVCWPSPEIDVPAPLLRLV
jgi:hypothetical protein